ncbi:MAG: hypothetical protein IBX45_12445 [Campylobacterales bacterium]|nr:hypothetical protein [Campylobacterales bacterium]
MKTANNYYYAPSPPQGRFKNAMTHLFCFAFAILIVTLLMPYMDAEWAIVREADNMNFITRYWYAMKFIVGTIFHIVTTLSPPPHDFLF